MKTSTPVFNALKNAVAIKAIPEVVVDWNMNRYYTAVAENMLTSLEIDNAFDSEYFPIESIVEPNRPNKGINKARVNDAVISDDYKPAATGTTSPRFYIADVDDTYKYWTSQTPSDAGTGALANCKPQVIYSATVAINKIVIKLENTWASPATFNIQTTTVAAPNDTTDWTTIATQATTPAGWKGPGVITLWYNGTNWTTATSRSDNADKSPKTQNIRGIRIVVTALEGGYSLDAAGATIATSYFKYVGSTRTSTTTDGKDAFFDLIEISGRLEVDLSPYVISTSTTLDMAESSDVYPIGTLTTNQANVRLSNLWGSPSVPGLFNADNTGSPYYNFIDENAKVTCSWNYYNADTGAFLDKVTEFVMYTDNWNGQDTDEVSVDVSDHSKFFNDQLVRACMWEDLTVPQIVWRLLDMVGFNNYNIGQDDTRVTEHKVPVFYTDGTQNLWEILDELARATQTAIYFDSYGVLQVRTRDFAFSSAASPSFNLTAVNDGTQLANIVDATGTTQFNPNYYTVVYQQTNWAPSNNDQLTMQKVWEPEGTVALRGTPLVRQLSPADTKLYIGADDVRLWPYSGIVNIQGELIRFDGKEFVFYTGTTGNVRNVEVIKTQDDYTSRNNRTPLQYRNKNNFTGGLAIIERAVWNSETKTHYVDANGYNVNRIVNGNRNTNTPGMRYLKQQSKVELANTGNVKDYRDIIVATHGATSDSPYFYYGFRFRFEKGRPQQCAGMIIHSQANAGEDGYYLEFSPSRRFDAKSRKVRDEIILYSRTSGVDHRVDSTPAAIVENTNYEVDLTYRNVGGNHKIQVWLNGKLVINKTISTNKNTPNGRFGMFIRGRTKATYEYIYGIAKLGDDPADDISLFDKVHSGYLGKQWDREWVYRWKTRTRRVKKKTNKSKHRIDQMFYDEFGPWVHELREFEVKFDPAPVDQSRLYLTNDWSALAMEYSADPFGAKFILANIERGNAVLSGEDNRSFGDGRTVNQVLTVFGRVLVVQDGANVIAKNDAQIRRRGKIESELSSVWIQSKGMATDISDWMNAHWSYGNDQLDVEAFGNPLIEVGDVVHVNYPNKHIDFDYFVVGVGNDFDAGLTTSLTLRRRV